MLDELIFYIHDINLLYSVGGLLLLGATLVLLYDYYCNKGVWFRTYLVNYTWLLIIGLTWGGVATTLLYSEVFGFVPCSLCWLQRVALYSQALMSVAAWHVRDHVLFPLYGMVLSGFGIVVAVYQYIYQAIPDEVRESGALPCLADGSADCSKTVMEVFGFVTFPFLSAVIFAFLFVLFLHLRRNSVKNL
jgi:disulfide bond formation protein DsbB